MAHIAVVGAGPAGLMAAQHLAEAGHRVDVYDCMPSAGRKFLLAGRGGLNLTHNEPFDHFVARYDAIDRLRPWLMRFNAGDCRSWASALGVATFVGTSGRVFPEAMKAAPLLRAWLSYLRRLNVTFHMRHRWIGWETIDAESRSDGNEIAQTKTLIFDTSDQVLRITPDATLLALGGGSWPRLGSDGAWTAILNQQHVAIEPLQAANCGFNVDWDTWFSDRYAGAFLKSISVTLPALDTLLPDPATTRRGEFVVSRHGVEGSLIYAHARALRTAINLYGRCTLWVDLLPDWTLERIVAELARPRGARSWSSHIQSRLGVKGVKYGLLRAATDITIFRDSSDNSQALAAAQVIAGNLKALPIHLSSPRPLEEAISTAGGIALPELDDHLMLARLPGVFCAGEMLDWEAPTGGYLLTACLASGVVAAEGISAWLQN